MLLLPRLSREEEEGGGLEERPLELEPELPLLPRFTLLPEDDDPRSPRLLLPLLPLLPLLLLPLLGRRTEPRSLEPLELPEPLPVDSRPLSRG